MRPVILKSVLYCTGQAVQKIWRSTICDKSCLCTGQFRVLQGAKTCRLECNTCILCTDSCLLLNLWANKECADTSLPCGLPLSSQYRRVTQHICSNLCCYTRLMSFNQLPYIKKEIQVTNTGNMFLNAHTFLYYFPSTQISLLMNYISHRYV